MAEFTVRWEIDLDAPDAEAAALLALHIQRDREPTALVFLVFDEKGTKTVMDLVGE